MSEFDEWFAEQIIGLSKYNNCYLGILKKEHPRWAGWKLIKQHTQTGVTVKEIKDSVIDLHVKNFYYLKYINEMCQR